MSDPLSTASGIAGLVSLGLTLCNGLHTYFSAIKDRHNDIESAAQSLELRKVYISIVQTTASKLKHHSSLAVGGLYMSLKNCKSELKCLEGLLLELVPVEDPPAINNFLRK
ncbi:hypothetical protein QWA68_015471 [Fusarium oxysporum]|nr:hypothetical protein QWA68_015471 [Fusarium oxysporum]